MTWFAVKQGDGAISIVLSVDGYEGEFVALDRRGDPHFEDLDWDTGTWSPRWEVIEAHLIARISSEAEAAKAPRMTGGEAKKLEYASKRAEVRAYRALTAADLAGLTPARAATLLPYAAALAQIGNVSIAEAVERFERGAVDSDGATALIAAIEDCAKAAVRAARAAGDVEAMHAAAAVSWPT